MPMFNPEIESMKTNAIHDLQEKRFVKMVRYAYNNKCKRGIEVQKGDRKVYKIACSAL